MTNPLNRTKVTQIVTRISKEINTIGEMKFPNTIFLEHQHDAFFVIPLELWNGE